MISSTGAAHALSPPSPNNTNPPSPFALAHIKAKAALNAKLSKEQQMINVSPLATTSYAHVHILDIGALMNLRETLHTEIRSAHASLEPTSSHSASSADASIAHALELSRSLFESAKGLIPWADSNEPLVASPARPSTSPAALRIVKSSSPNTPQMASPTAKPKSTSASAARGMQSPSSASAVVSLLSPVSATPIGASAPAAAPADNSQPAAATPTADLQVEPEQIELPADVHGVSSTEADDDEERVYQQTLLSLTGDDDDDADNTAHAVSHREAADGLHPHPLRSASRHPESTRALQVPAVAADPAPSPSPVSSRLFEAHQVPTPASAFAPSPASGAARGVYAPGLPTMPPHAMDAQSHPTLSVLTDSTRTAHPALAISEYIPVTPAAAPRLTSPANAFLAPPASVLRSGGGQLSVTLTPASPTPVRPHQALSATIAVSPSVMAVLSPSSDHVGYLAKKKQMLRQFEKEGFESFEGAALDSVGKGSILKERNRTIAPATPNPKSPSKKQESASPRKHHSNDARHLDVPSSRPAPTFSSPQAPQRRVGAEKENVLPAATSASPATAGSRTLVNAGVNARRPAIVWS